MAKRQRTTDPDPGKTYFESQREALISDIALVGISRKPLSADEYDASYSTRLMSFEHVLGNINKLNRSLEEVIKMGNDFSSVEALWSQFESVMVKEDERPKQEQEEATEQTKGEGES
ncbi:hypothetical protein E4U21_000243 [Claviceps maximensis]|nr:hypothetical protein E4U21_000243 [Claviceps maximensis]